MQNSDNVVSLKYVVDQGSQQQILDSTARVENAIVGISDANNAVGDSAPRIAEVGQQAAEATAAAEGLRDTLVDASQVDLRGVTTGLTSLSRLAMNIPGLRGAGEALRVSDEISRVSQNLPRLTEGIADLGNQLAASSGLFTSVSNDAYGLVASLSATGAPLTATAAGFTSLVAIVGPAALAVGAVGLAFVAFENTLKDVEATVAQAGNQLDLYYQDYGQYTTEEAQKKLQQLQQDKDNADKEAANFKQVMDSAASQVKEGTTGALTGIADGIISIFAPAAGGMHVAEAAVTSYIDSQKGLSDEYNKAVNTSKSLQTQIDALQASMNQGGTKAKDAAEATDKFNASLDKLVAKDFSSFFSDIGQGIEDLAKFTQDNADLSEQRRLRDSQQEADYQTQKTQKVADHYTQLAQQDSDFYAGEADKLQKLYETADQTYAKAQADVVKEQVQYAQQQRDNAQKLADDIQKITSHSRESELDAASRLDARAIAQQERQKQDQISGLVDTYNSQKQISDRNEAEKEADQLASAQAEHDQRIAQGVQAIKDEERQYEAKKQRDEAKFQLDLKRMDDQEKLKEQRQQEADDRQDAQRRAAFVKQETALAGHMSQMLLGQSAGQGNILTAWNTFWNNLKASIPTSTPTAAPVTQSAASAPSPAYQAYQNPTAPISSSNVYNQGYIPSSTFYGISAGMPDAYSTLGSPYAPSSPTNSVSSGGADYAFTPAPPVIPTSSTVTSSQFQAAGSNNYEQFLGFAGGGSPPLNRPVKVAEGGKPELAIFGQRAHILDGNSTARILDAIDSSTGAGGKGRGGVTVNGPLIGTINGTGLDQKQLTAAVEEALANALEGAAEL